MEFQINDSRPAQRRCLRCGKDFSSRGPGNRICHPCRKINNRLGFIPESVMQKLRGTKRRNGFPLDPEQM
jgi:hypothetical protein